LTEYDDRQEKAKRDGGNLAERKAREYCERKGIGFARFGFDELDTNRRKFFDGLTLEDSFPYWKIAATIRAAPDFIIYSPSKRWSWLEAKGFARHNGNGFRLHAKKIPHYQHWQAWYPVLLFIHDIDNDNDYIVRLDSLTQHIEETGMEPSGYYDQRTMGKKKPFFEFFEEVLEPLNLANALRDRPV